MQNSLTPIYCADRFMYGLRQQSPAKFKIKLNNIRSLNHYCVQTDGSRHWIIRTSRSRNGFLLDGVEMQQLLTSCSIMKITYLTTYRYIPYCLTSILNILIKQQCPSLKMIFVHVLSCNAYRKPREFIITSFSFAILNI